MKFVRLRSRALVLFVLAAILAVLIMAALHTGMRAGLRLPPETVVDLARPGDAPTIGRIYFGGPDRQPGALSRLLLDRVNATPPGQRISRAQRRID